MLQATYVEPAMQNFLLSTTQASTMKTSVYLSYGWIRVTT